MVTPSPIEQIDPLDVGRMTNDELLAEQSRLEEIRKTYFAKVELLKTDPRFKKRLGTAPTPVINPLFENVYNTVNNEVTKRNLNWTNNW